MGYVELDVLLSKADQTGAIMGFREKLWD